MPKPKAPEPVTKRFPKKASEADAGKPAFDLIDQRIAALPGPKFLLNSSLEGNVRRVIDFGEGGTIEERPRR